MIVAQALLSRHDRPELIRPAGTSTTTYDANGQRVSRALPPTVEDPFASSHAARAGLRAQVRVFYAAMPDDDPFVFGV